MSKLAQTPRILADDFLWLLWARSLPHHSLSCSHGERGTPQRPSIPLKHWGPSKRNGHVQPLSCSLCSPGPWYPPSRFPLQVPCLFCTEEWPGRMSLALPTAEHRGGTAGATRSAAALPPHCEALSRPMVYHQPSTLLTASTDLWELPFPQTPSTAIFLREHESHRQCSWNPLPRPSP